MNCHGWRRGPLLLLLPFFAFVSGCGQMKSGWESFPIPIYVDVSIAQSSAAMADFEDGLRYWEDRSQRKLFDVKGIWNRQSPAYHGRPENPDSIPENVVLIEDRWSFANHFVGMTVSKPFEFGQRAMVMINPNTPFCHGDCLYQYGFTSLRKTFAHEMGHFLGLTHASDPNNIMYERSQPGGVLQHLSVDDSALRSIVQAGNN
jgi:hypothetical protein